MVGIPWDQPGADPLADMQEFQQQARARWGDSLDGYPLFVGAAVYDRLTELLGREPTVEDIPAGVPGRWTSIERVD